MALRHRPMRPEDVQECVEIVAAHPTLGPQYGSGIPWIGRWTKFSLSRISLA